MRSLEERLWAKIDTSGGPDACWPWGGGTTKHGYGQIKVEGRVKYAHRLAVHAPPGVHVRHFVCDNPPCCNPRHLRFGSQQQNIADAVAKGRMGRPSGARDRVPRARPTHCKREHAFTPENTRVRANGSRVCLTCDRMRQADRRSR